MEINGIEYKKRDLKTLSKGATKLVMMAQMFGGLKAGSRNIEGVNIIQEFILIQEKKSKLSKAQRDSVIWEFNRHYEKAT